MENVWEILHDIPWFAWIPIVGVICITAVSMTKMITSHRERMEKIRHGMDQ